MKVQANPLGVKLIYNKNGFDPKGIKEGILINGGFFWWEGSQMLSASLTVIDGKQVEAGYHNRPVLQVKENKAWISDKLSPCDWAIQGGPELVRDGKEYPFVDLGYNAGGIQPAIKRQRTLIGIMPNGDLRAEILASATTGECRRYALAEGYQQAMLLDGGGSSTFIDNGKVVFGGERRLMTGILFPRKEDKKVPVVGIDIGHGGKDPGATGPTGVKEKDVVLSVGLECIKELERHGINIVATRKSDTYLTLFERSNILNNANCDIVVSIHCNGSTNRDANYMATFVIKKGFNAEKLAASIQKEAVGLTKWPDGGVRESNLHMVRETKAPAALVECGFISNPLQETWLTSSGNQKNMGKAIAKGILEYLGVSYRTSVQEAKFSLTEVFLNGRLLDNKAIVMDGVSYLPIRELSEKLGLSVNWDGQVHLTNLTKSGR